MSQPHFPYISLLRQSSSFTECHVLIAFCLLQLVILAVHPFADEKLYALHKFRNTVNRSAVCAVCYGNALAVFPHYHIRRISLALMLHTAFLL